MGEVIDFNKYKQIRRVKFENQTTDAEVAREIGDVTVLNEEGEHEIMKGGQVRKEMLLEAKSGESIDQFTKRVVRKKYGLEGSDYGVKKRNKVVDFVARKIEAIIKPKKELPNFGLADDYPVADVDRDYEEYKKVKGV